MKRRRDRSGYAAVLFILLFFVFMGLAALVIDLGFARLAQRQMQTAADSAALEGLRWRDVQHWEDLPQAWVEDPDFQALTGGPTSPPYTGTISPQQRETVRRWAASRMVANTFDDNLDPTNGDTGQYGAGPVVDFTGGVGPQELAASQLMKPGNPPVYKPKRSDGTPGLELNYDETQRDEIHGDMVAGTYGQNTVNPPDGAADGRSLFFGALSQGSQERWWTALLFVSWHINDDRFLPSERKTA